MSELPQSNQWDREQLLDSFIFDFHEKLSNTLDKKIPTKFNEAVALKRMYDEAGMRSGYEDVAESNLFWTFDLLTDAIPNYRILLKPREMFKGITFKNDEIKRLIINIPTPFIDKPSDGEPNNIESISVCIVDIELADGETHTYALSHKEVIPFDFRHYDYDFIFDGTDVKINIILNTESLDAMPESKLNLMEQVEISDIVAKALDGTYILARLSRHDGTTDKLQ